MRHEVHTQQSRRSFIHRVAAASMLPLTGSRDDTRSNQPTKGALKVSLNAFSFNAPLTAGSMNIDDMIIYCASVGFSAVDITGYYFKGYPLVPDDKYLYNIKRKAFRHGIEISGTGVRNDFTEPDSIKRKESVKLVKSWIDVAEKIGAPVIRIFAGNQQSEKFTRQQVLDWLMTDVKECVDYGEKHGVMVGIQNHDDFIKTGDQALEIINSLKSDWFGLILDTGSYRVGDPYGQIQQTAQYAINWQIKEKVFVNGKEIDVEMDKLINIIKASGYNGYIPLETLGDGDPKTKILTLFDKINKSLSKA